MTRAMMALDHKGCPELRLLPNGWAELWWPVVGGGIILIGVYPTTDQAQAVAEAMVF